MSKEKVWRAPQARPGKLRSPDQPCRLSLVSIYKMQKKTRSISQTEKAVEREQIRSNEQVLPTSDLEPTSINSTWRQ
jgi:hypothetical protein